MTTTHHKIWYETVCGGIRFSQSNPYRPIPLPTEKQILPTEKLVVLCGGVKFRKDNPLAPQTPHTLLLLTKGCAHLPYNREESKKKERTSTQQRLTFYIH